MCVLISRWSADGHVTQRQCVNAFSFEERTLTHCRFLFLDNVTWPVSSHRLHPPDRRPSDAPGRLQPVERPGRGGLFGKE